MKWMPSWPQRYQVDSCSVDRARVALDKLHAALRLRTGFNRLAQGDRGLYPPGHPLWPSVHAWPQVDDLIVEYRRLWNSRSRQVDCRTVWAFESLRPCLGSASLDFNEHACRIETNLSITPLF